MLEWVAISFSRGSFQPKDCTCVSCWAGGFFLYHWATGETPAVAYNIITGARSQTQSQERSGKRKGLTYALIEGFWHAEARGGLIVSRTSYVIAPCRIFDFLFLFLSWKWEQKLGNLAVTDQVLTLVSWLLWRLWVRELFFHIWSGHLSVFQGSSWNILGGAILEILPIAGIYKKTPTANIQYNGKRLNVFPLSSGPRRCLCSPLLFNMELRVSASAINQEKEIYDI